MGHSGRQHQTGGTRQHDPHQHLALVASDAALLGVERWAVKIDLLEASSSARPHERKCHAGSSGHRQRQRCLKAAVLRPVPA